MKNKIYQVSVTMNGEPTLYRCSDLEKIKNMIRRDFPFHSDYIIEGMHEQKENTTNMNALESIKKAINDLNNFSKKIEFEVEDRLFSEICVWKELLRYRFQITYYKRPVYTYDFVFVEGTEHLKDSILEKIHEEVLQNIIKFALTSQATESGYGIEYDTIDKL